MDQHNIQPVLKEIQHNIVYQRSLDLDHQGWHQMAVVIGRLYTYIDGDDSDVYGAINSARRWFQNALDIPKYHRSADFRRAVHVVAGFVDVIEALLGERRAMIDNIHDLESENSWLLEELEYLKVDKLAQKESQKEAE